MAESQRPPAGCKWGYLVVAAVVNQAPVPGSLTAAIRTRYSVFPRSPVILVLGAVLTPSPKVLQFTPSVDVLRG